MGEFKGTKGPWLKEVVKGNIMVTGGKIYPKRPEFNSLSIKVGYISSDDCGNPTCCCVEEHANALLIASAPDLLTALQNLVHLHMCEQEGLSSGQPSPTDWLKAVDLARVTISKALS